MKKDTKKLVYVEPADYFPKKLRKKYGLGEFSEEVQKKSSGTTAKKKVKRK